MVILCSSWIITAAEWWECYHSVASGKHKHKYLLLLNSLWDFVWEKEDPTN